MHNLKSLLVTVVAILALTACLAPRAQAQTETFPWHNGINALDVDDNSLLQPRDALLVINRLLDQQSSGALDVQPQVDLETVFYWDTSNDNLVTPHDALLVINGLIAPAPEPSSMALAGCGLLALGGLGLRRLRRRK